MMFILRALQVLRRLGMQQDGFFNIGVDCVPNLLPRSGDRVENSSVPLFPDLPEDET
jgi:hypothetical protein